MATKRVDLLNIVLLGLIAYGLAFGLHFALCSDLRNGPEFVYTLYLAAYGHLDLISCHPDNIGV